jgi:hypothetical protein
VAFFNPAANVLGLFFEPKLRDWLALLPALLATPLVDSALAVNFLWQVAILQHLVTLHALSYQLAV